MKNNLSSKLNAYLIRTMILGIVCIVVAAFFSSIAAHKKSYIENQRTLQYFSQSVVTSIGRRISTGELETIKKRMDFYVQNEKDRNLQIKIANNKQEVLYQSPGYVGNCDFKISTFQKNITVCDRQEVVFEGALLGIVSVSRDVRSFYSFFLEFYLPALSFILLLFISLFFVMNRRFLKVNVVEPLDQLVRNLEENKDLENDTALRGKAHEWSILHQAIQDYRKKITGYIIKQNKIHADLEKEKILSDVTSQLAYEIRSPLAALDMMANNISELDGEKRTLIKKATARIHDISNNLFSRSTQQNQDLSLQMLSSLVRSMLFEKREQYKSNHKITISEYIDPQMYGVFAKIDTNDFKSVLSHVIDNAVQAIPNAGFVRVALTQKDENIIIDVFDNGKGIPAEILHRVTARGVSYNKEGGNGLGLYLTDQKMREWGGRLEIESTVQSGTSIRLIFKKEPVPPWFVSEIAINDDGQYVVLDDDYTVHEMWEDKILQAVKKSIKIHHFENEKDFENWFGKSKPQDKNMFYFFDYELIGNKNSGLDIIEKWGISSNAILVTSNYENEDVQKRCEKIGVRMIPKELARLVPIINT